MTTAPVAVAPAPRGEPLEATTLARGTRREEFCPPMESTEPRCRVTTVRAATPGGPFTAVEVVQAEEMPARPGGSAEALAYGLALQTARGWFFFRGLSTPGSDGAAGSSFVTRHELESVERHGERVVLRLRTEVTRYCQACDTEAERRRPQPWSQRAQVVVCGVGASGAPGCVGPLFAESHRDEAAPQCDAELTSDGGLRVGAGVQDGAVSSEPAVSAGEHALRFE